ncbi:MAG: hypothetical protein QOF60_1561 [Actinomycetota bacterium]|jgi:uncharacterized cofD-like protein|nr:hypothetical protein [Actinomycetota bacterium]
MTNVVALGGGHGTAATLGAARKYATTITAIVSVADDGGSSGRLRQALGIPAPGDLRRCLVALAKGDNPQDNPVAMAFEHRFGDDADPGLKGHALGNLVIAGLTAATGNFVEALHHAGRMLEAQGRVLPATADAVVLKAVAAGGEVEGQVAVAKTSRIAYVTVVPPDARPPEQALDAIEHADQLVLGPGSLFTSVLAVVAVPAIRQALAQRTQTQRLVYVCNLRTSAETVGFDVAAHLDALTAHGVEPDVVLHDPAAGMATGRPSTDIQIVEADLATDDQTAHDPAKLARALADLVG